MCCSRVTHRTVGPFLKLQFSSSKALVFSCQKESHFNRGKDEKSVVLRVLVLIGSESEMCGKKKKNSSQMKVLISI